MLKYVGAYPIVTHKGISFDHTKPDRYIYLSAIMDILNSIENSNEKDIYIDIKDHAKDMISDNLYRYCPDIDDVFKTKEIKVEQVILRYQERAKTNPNLSQDEKQAILGNIAIMRDYYKQYMINKKVYECTLNTLADMITAKHINTIKFIVGRNYGMVLSDLAQVLQDHKPPLDVTMDFINEDDKTYGILDMHR